jgi:hypothetical protein
MALDTTFFGNDIDYALSDISHTWTISTTAAADQEIAVIKSTVENTQEVEEAGILNPSELIVICKVSDFEDSVLPVFQKVGTISSIKYAIETISVDPDGVGVKFGLRRV